MIQPYTYIGREYDPETGLYYYRARYYDPKIGRFLEEDPLGLKGGINLYSYTGNNPINYRDPFGLLVEVLSRRITSIRIGNRVIDIVHLLIRIYEIDKCGKEITKAVYEIEWAPPWSEPELMMDPETLRNPNNTGQRYPIPPPPGMSQEKFERNIAREVASYDFPNYWPKGPNSNTFVDNVIEGAGGTMPNIPGAIGQNYGE